MELDVERKLKELERHSYENDSPQFLKHYNKAQCLVVEGKYTEAVASFRLALEGVRAVKDNFLWQRMYENIGTAFTQTLDYLGSVQEADDVFSELLSVFPTGNFIGDYAVFLHRRKRDFAQADAFYRKALELCPTQSSIHLKYAGFLRHIKKDMSEAEVHYRAAVDCNPHSAEALGSFASYLHGAKGQKDAAESLYERAVLEDATHANNLCNFGLFLSEERGKYERAEQLYRTALVNSPQHSNTLYNYAVMLDTHCKRKAEAQNLYQQCIEVEPNHSYALYNLAVLMEEKLAQRRRQGTEVDIDESAEVAGLETDKSLVCSLYTRALNADPRDATTAADLGRFLLTAMNDDVAAERALQAALQLDPASEVALFNLAVLKQTKRNDLKAAEGLLRSLLSAKPSHGAGLHQFARLTLDKLKLDSRNCSLEEVMVAYEKAMSAQRDASSAAIEYVKVVSSYGANPHKLRAASTLEAILKSRSAESRAAEVGQLLEQLRKSTSI